MQNIDLKSLGRTLGLILNDWTGVELLFRHQCIPGRCFAYAEHITKLDCRADDDLIRCGLECCPNLRDSSRRNGFLQ